MVDRPWLSRVLTAHAASSAPVNCALWKRSWKSSRPRVAVATSAGRWYGSPKSCAAGSASSTPWPGSTCCCTGSAGKRAGPSPQSQREGRFEDRHLEGRAVARDTSGTSSNARDVNFLCGFRCSTVVSLRQEHAKRHEDEANRAGFGTSGRGCRTHRSSTQGAAVDRRCTPPHRDEAKRGLV